MQSLVALICGVLIATGCSPDTSVANGRAIFRTGRDSAGIAISAAKPPLRTNCQACHGAASASAQTVRCRRHLARI